MLWLGRRCARFSYRSSSRQPRLPLSALILALLFLLDGRQAIRTFLSQKAARVIHDLREDVCVAPQAIVNLIQARLVASSASRQADRLRRCCWSWSCSGVAGWRQSNGRVGRLA